MFVHAGLFYVFLLFLYIKTVRYLFAFFDTIFIAYIGKGWALIMGIDPKRIKEILVANEVTQLYHANTVVTSLTFLRSGGLLSRGYVEDINAPQTSQQTDDSDKDLGIYYDIFFDATDIHQQARNLNFYGPVSFVYSIDVLDHPNIEVKVTKRNPQYWASNQDEAERYFLDESELEFCYNPKDFGQHITICDMHAPLPFIPYLQKIIMDDPQIEDNKYFVQAVSVMQKELVRQGIVAPLCIRECPEDCKCHKAYREHKEGYVYHRFKTKL